MNSVILNTGIIRQPVIVRRSLEWDHSRLLAYRYLPYLSSMMISKMFIYGGEKSFEHLEHLQFFKAENPCKSITIRPC